MKKVLKLSSLAIVLMALLTLTACAPKADKAEEKMEKTTADVAWEQAVEETNNNLKEEDKNVLKMLSKLLGQTDTDGQISQIEITENFLEGQIKDAMEAKQKNERLYTRLGTIVGLAIVIVLC